jgi:hypothetical protein
MKKKGQKKCGINDCCGGGKYFAMEMGGQR